MRRVLILLLPLFLIPIVKADGPFIGGFNVIGRCDSCCIESYPITFTITLDNTNYFGHYIIEDYWVETEAGTTLERLRNQNITLSQHDMLNLYITSSIPPVLNETFGYKACIKYSYTDDFFIHKVEERCSILETKSAFPLSKYFGSEICCIGDDCASTEQCLSNYTCSELNCSYCEYILEHGCVPFQCCADEECNETSICDGNECIPIVCAGEIVNRTCMSWFGLPVFTLPQWINDVFGEGFGDFLQNNIVLIIFGVIFFIVFIVLIVWLLKGGGEGKKKVEKPTPKITLGGKEIGKKPEKMPKAGKEPKKKGKTKKKTKKSEKKEKEPKKGEEEGPEYVPLVELPE